MPKTLYLVGGPMGVGKTATCRELNRLLPRSVLLDGDWCWFADPFQVTPETKAMVLDNICHLLTSFLRCSAYDNVILCWVLHEQGIVDAILGQLPLEAYGAELRHVSLVADDAALRSRVEEDVRAGLRDTGAAERSLAYLPLYERLSSTLIDTTLLTPRMAAERVMAATGSSTGAPPRADE